MDLIANKLGLGQKLIDSEAIKKSIQINIDKKLQSLQQEEIQKKMQIKYQKYFKHWKDFDLLTCILAMIGLSLAVVDYELTPNFYDVPNKIRKPLEDIVSESYFVRVVITITTFLAILALLFRMWLYTFWIDFKNSKVFYLKLMEQQQNARDEELEKANPNNSFKREQKIQKESQMLKFFSLIFSWEFFFEFTILAIHSPPGWDKEYTFYFLNMLTNKDQNMPVPYFASDFIFALMFLRLYFLIRTLLNYSMYADLYAKKICTKYGFEGSISFQVRALFVKKPALIIILTASISIGFLSYVLRIFERVYYNSQGYILFDSYFTSIWCVIITMTTVGYGDVFAVSLFGRLISIINALWGAFVISLLVGSIQGIFNMPDNQKRAVAEITNSKQAAASIRSSIQYFNAKYDNKNNEKLPAEEKVDYVPTKKDVKCYRNSMVHEVDKLKSERIQNNDILPPESSTEKDLQVVKEQILDLNDKFDYLLYLLVKDNKIGKEKNSEEFALQPNQDIGDADEVVRQNVATFAKVAKNKSISGNTKFRSAEEKVSMTQRILDLKRQMKEQIEVEERIVNEQLKEAEHNKVTQQ